MHSKDDELDYEQAMEISNQLGAELITYTDRSHLNNPKDASVILEVLRKELDF